MATITFELPDDIGKHLAAIVADIDEAAKEAAVVELYRQGQLSHGALAECLGLSRFEADAVLVRHHVTEDLPTVDDFRDQVRALRARLVS